MDLAEIAMRSESTMVKGIAMSVVSVDKKVNVSFAGTTIGCRADRDVTIAVGDVVYGFRLGQEIYIVGRLFAGAPAEASIEEVSIPPKPQPETVYGTLIIPPVETRSYRPNWGWRKDNDSVYQGEYTNGNHTGCAFYGTKPRSIAGATVTSASIRAKRVSGGDYAARETTLRRITNKTKPSGAPTLIAGDWDGPRLAVGKSDGSVSIPTSWAQDLVDGNAGGLAIYESDGSPYVQLAGRASWSQSFTLTIKWKRVT
jgi:hypothetical protein